ncbi:hypothetical protein DPEC_G00342620 [Dallia pectoralis]|uniref:Uncharacterized protein n=1 Tax=Dallia pectoralis TaxID=75939 RepID=A0ACC2F5S8_DALPE|nr:hypothetical protein DPEC_G00342620 [Dallia pectoralis]
MLHDSNDQAVRQANIVVKTGPKWKASGALREAEEHLQHGDIMVTVTQGRLGLGVITRARGRSLSWKDIWNMEGHRPTEGRFRWRHAQVLAQRADGLEKVRKRKRPTAQYKGPRFICFLRPGEKAGKEYRYLGILGTADDWEMRVDLGRQLKFPEKIAVTSLRPNIVLWSQTTRQVALIELTVSWEERTE